MQDADAHIPPGLPVVIGSSFSGLMVSLHLSQSGVDHILLGGGEPNGTPRLGESLNECASPELFGRFAEENSDCFFTKSHISLLNGEYATQIQFADPHRCVKKAASHFATAAGPWPHNRFRTFLGSITGTNLMHVDRLKLDPVVYRETIKQPQCRFVQKQVDRVDMQDDAVARLHLQDGSVIESPKYVLDTTGFRGIVANAAGVKTEPISSLQRVVWTHHHAPCAKSIPRRWWRQGTNLLKLEEKIDGYDGISWMIPIGEYISVGVSMDAEKYPSELFDKDEAISLLGQAYARRGVDYPELFPEQRREICELTHRYYIRERAYGPNWLLVGGSYVSVWFPSSAGLWTTVAACRLLPHIFDQPEELGMRYEKTLMPLLDFHKHLESMIHGETFKSHKQAMKFWSRWVADVPTRLGLYLDLPEPTRAKVPSRYGFMRLYGKMMRKFPTLQLALWGSFITRTSHHTDLSKHSSSFNGYFWPFAFRTRNYLLCSLRWLNPFTS